MMVMMLCAEAGSAFGMTGTGSSKLFDPAPTQTVAKQQNLVHPKIPSQDKNENKVAIVLTEEFQSKQEIEKQLMHNPEVKVRRVFKHAIPGYSWKDRSML